MKQTIEISWVSLWRILFFVVLTVVLYHAQQILLGLFLALVISSGLESAIDFLELYRIPRILGVISVFLFAIALVTVMMYAVLPQVIIDVNSILSTARNPNLTWLGSIADISKGQSFTDVFGKFSGKILSGDSAPISFLSQALGGVALALTVIVTSFYLSLSKDGVERFIRVVFPRDYEEGALRLYRRSKKKAGQWFRTQILLSVIIGVLVWAAMTILGVRHSFLLGLIAGIFEIVPFVGPIIAGGAAVISAMVDSTGLAVITLLVFVAIQQVEGHLLVPLLMKRNVGIHPVIVIVALLIGAEIQGLLGILVAVPAAAVIQEIVEEWSDNRKPAAIPANP